MHNVETTVQINEVLPQKPITELGKYLVEKGAITPETVRAFYRESMHKHTAEVGQLVDRIVELTDEDGEITVLGVKMVGASRRLATAALRATGSAENTAASILTEDVLPHIVGTALTQEKVGVAGSAATRPFANAVEYLSIAYALDPKLNTDRLLDAYLNKYDGVFGETTIDTAMLREALKSFGPEK